VAKRNLGPHPHASGYAPASRGTFHKKTGPWVMLWYSEKAVAKLPLSPTGENSSSDRGGVTADFTTTSSL